MYSDWFFTSLCWCSSWVRGGREGCPGICAVNITTRMPGGYRSYYTQMHTKVLCVFVLPLIVNYTSNKLYTVIMYLFFSITGCFGLLLGLVLYGSRVHISLLHGGIHTS